MRAALAMMGVAVAVAVTAHFGIIWAMEKGSPAVQYRVFIATEGPTNYVIRVVWPHTNTFSISTDGEGLIDIPALPRGCSLVCLGMKLQDGSPYNWKVIEVLRDGRVVRRLSLRQIDRLPADTSGRRTLSL
jgi:hypothetical protein